jgi:hypothetical protein
MLDLKVSGDISSPSHISISLSEMMPPFLYSTEDLYSVAWATALFNIGDTVPIFLQSSIASL